MDVFFHEDHELLLSSSSDSSLFWPDEYAVPVASHLPVPGGSSFLPYPGADASGGREQAGPGRSGNMNRRVLEFARRSWPESARSRELVRERGYRHMMSERMRRERQKQSYSALHSLLPRGTKNEKNSIVQAASTEIQDLQRRKEDLQRRNRDLKASLGGVGVEDDDMVMGGTKIKIRIGNPESGIDSMLQVLGCLDSLGLEMASVRSSFSSEECSAVVEIQEETEAAEIEKVIQNKLLEARTKLLPKCHGV